MPGSLDPLWLKAAFLLFLVGYGTKMGLAPLHTWLPDAHSEAPSVVSALLSGALLNCAFLAILRVHAGAGGGRAGGDSARSCWCSSAWSRWPWRPCSSSARRISSGCWPIPASSTWASWRWASASAAWPASARMLHAVNHSLTKAMLFLAGRQHPGRLPHQVDRQVPRPAAASAGHRRALAGRLPGDHRLAAVRAVPQRIDDPQRRLSTAVTVWLAVVYLAALAVVFVAWRRSCCAWPMAQRAKPGRIPAEGCRRALNRCGRWCRRPCLPAGVLVLGVYVPPRAERVCCTTRPRQWEADDVPDRSMPVHITVEPFRLRRIAGRAGR